MPVQTRKTRSRKTPISKPPNSASRPVSQRSMSDSTDATFRSTATHVFFWGGILSNWSCNSKFSGARSFELLLPDLEKLGVAYPAMNMFSSRLLADHMFNCGEQWMMAMKAWLFEQSLKSDTADWVVEEDGEADFTKMKAAMYETKIRSEWSADAKERAMWNGTVCKLLRTNNPRQQKQLGRKAQGFDEKVWSKVNVLCVTAACVARAEADQELREVYIASGDRKFVEGSPKDRIWGVGLHWKDVEIEDPASWRGENRLGECHDQAALKFRTSSS